MSDYDDDYSFDEADYMRSDDPAFQEVLQESLVTARPNVHRDRDTYMNHTSTAANGSLHQRMDESDDKAHVSQWTRKQELKRRIADIDADVQGIKESIKSLQTQLSSKESQKEQLVRDLHILEHSAHQGAISNGKGKGKASTSRELHTGINYIDGDFEWETALRSRMKSVFGIDEFRLCQRGICNANMDGRDIVVVMPTGGGKSLTYQLPALLTPGCTLVISPLISLIMDQILHLQSRGVAAVAITGGTPTSEKKDTIRRLRTLAERRLDPGELEIKLCYVTPEKLAKDASFRSLLQTLVQAGKLARIVIDEAHCVSQMGHDFRPDYQKLHILRTLLPSVPIMALSATCPPLVLKDLLKTLRLAGIVHGRNAKASGTVYFSAPLYRKNLHYQVVQKPAKGSEVTKVMVDYILEHHPNDSGIVYCLSRKNTETVAQELENLSGRRIKTGVYHADRPEAEKSQLHHAWRVGKIKVVCATIAFGLGIDKADVRFVLHHSMSKSLEGYYQESGRAGRDGKDADCVMYYRPQDSATISSMVAAEKSGQEKLHAILDFAEDLVECRKIQFAKYFSHSSDLSIASWTTEDQDALDRCGHCDNCTRPPESIECKDVTLQTWQLLKVVQHVRASGANVTINQLATLARSNNGGTFEIPTGNGRTKSKEKKTLDLKVVAGGPVDLSKDDIEHLIIRLLIKNYLKEEYQQTAYSTNSYVAPGQLAPRLIHESREHVMQAAKPLMEMTVVKPIAKAKTRRRKNVDDSGDCEDTTPSSKKQKTTIARKGKGKNIGVDEDLDDMYMPDITSTNGILGYQAKQGKSKVGARNQGFNNHHPIDDGIETIDLNFAEDDSDSNVSYDWSHSMLVSPPVTRPRRDVGNSKAILDREILVLSD